MTEITLFTAKPTGGGAEVVFTSLARYFSEEGIKTDFILLDSGDREFNAGEANIIEVPHTRTRYALPWLVQYLNKTSPDVIYSTLTGPNLVTVLASKISHVDSTVVVTEAAIRSKSAKAKQSRGEHILNLGARVLYPRADSVVTMSESAGEDMRRFLWGRGNVAAIPNPVDIERVRQAAAKQVTHEWFSGDYNVILGVGRLVPVKDFTTLIKAFDIYSGEKDRLVILGEGPERNKLEQLVKQKGISGVDLLGYVDNPYRFMKRADVLVSTSKFEAFGNVIVEALACGTPVIATDCPGGPSEILTSDEYGELAPVGEVEEIANLIKTVLNRDYDQDVLVDRAGNYSLESIAAQYLELGN
jgi:glycosyltransferase involved in cell wall biosynthesis